MRNRKQAGVLADDAEAFREAIRGAVPLRARPRARNVPPKPAAVPVRSLLDAHEALRESAGGPGHGEQSMETGEELAFLRNGVRSGVLRKLRRGHWVVQAEVDLHGMNRTDARAALAEFLSACVRRGSRCVRIVHGKGLRSPNREPVLKSKMNQWLSGRDEVLAYCQAPEPQGGSGALLVLLRG